MKTLLYALALVTLFAIGASSLECIICNSVTDKNCDHGSDVDVKKYLKPCNTTEDSFKKQLPALPANATYKLCRKMVTVVDFDVNGNPAGERIKRTCGWDDSEEKYNDECYYRAGLGGRITVCTCMEDKCNDGDMLKNSYFLLAALCAAAFTVTRVWA